MALGLRILGKITGVETIAHGTEIRDLPRLLRMHGFGRWRKRKGFAAIELEQGGVRRVELHALG